MTLRPFSSVPPSVPPSPPSIPAMYSGSKKRNAAAALGVGIGELTKEQSGKAGAMANGTEQTNDDTDGVMGDDANGGVGGGGDAGSSTGEEVVAAVEGGGEAAVEAEKKRKGDFGRLTELADALLQAGQHDVYQQTKEDLEEAAEAAAARASSSGEPWPGAGRGVRCVACHSHLTVDHASFSKRSTVPVPNKRLLQRLGAHYVFACIT